MAANTKVGLGFGDPLTVVEKASADSPYTVQSTDQVVALTVDGSITVNLSTAATFGLNKRLIIKDVSGGAGVNNVTIDGAGAETIDGRSSILLTSNYATVTLMAVTGGWAVV